MRKGVHTVHTLHRVSPYFQVMVQSPPVSGKSRHSFVALKEFFIRHGFNLAMQLLMFFLSVGSLLKSAYVDMKRKYFFQILNE